MPLSIRRSLIAIVVSAAVAPAMTITIAPDAGLSGNTAALGAFQRAANTWASLFTDNAAIVIRGDLYSFGSGKASIIGQTTVDTYTGTYDYIRSLMVNDASDEPADAIVASLPWNAQFTATLGAGDSLARDSSSGQLLMAITGANLKALGYTGTLAPEDATIAFNSDFSFSYGPVTAGKMDFYGVALHEIGHALGFVSSVDWFDTGATTAPLTTLDLFRFSSSGYPTTSSGFTTTARDLKPGSAAVFSDTTSDWAMSVGANSHDYQASHWKNNLGIGVMDPTLAPGETERITAADLRAFDLIGYDLATPEPGTLLLLAGSLALLAIRKRALGR
jgi:hypothetical protein